MEEKKVEQPSYTAPKYEVVSPAENADTTYYSYYYSYYYFY